LFGIEQREGRHSAFKNPCALSASAHDSGIAADEGSNGVERAVAKISKQVAKMATSLNLMKRWVGMIERAIGLEESK